MWSNQRQRNVWLGEGRVRGPLVEHPQSWGHSETSLAVHNQVQLTLSTEIIQCVNDLPQCQIWEEIGQVLDPTTRLVSDDVEDVSNHGVIRLHGKAFFLRFSDLRGVRTNVLSRSANEVLTACGNRTNFLAEYLSAALPFLTVSAVRLFADSVMRKR